MRQDSLAAKFQELFNQSATYSFFCPGRVNIIGEHIDYNGGKVMPCAIEKGTWLVAAKNDQQQFRFRCLNFPETADFPIQGSYQKSGKAWYNYPLGVINEFVSAGESMDGLDLLYYGNIPIGAGLSSSASIEVLTGFASSKVFNIERPLPQLALLSQHAENSFVGVNCGIMDQFAVAMGKKEQAILLDCNSLDYDYLPFDISPYVLVIINTNKQRSLADSKYNERHAECQSVLKILQKDLPVQQLCDIRPFEFEQQQPQIKDRLLLKRARHVIMENARVNDATVALQSKDLVVLGKLMFASHESLRYDYEVSCNELDVIVDFCKEYKNCIGARMTGAGFGGCAIAIIHQKQLEDFSKLLTADYKNKTGLDAEIFATHAEKGVHQLD